MKKIYLDRAKDLVADRYETITELLADLDAVLPSWNEAGPYARAKELVQAGCFAIYYTQVLKDLNYIFGDDYDETRYKTKSGDLRWRGGECYAWSIYKNIIATAIADLVMDERAKEIIAAKKRQLDAPVMERIL